jgi:23S rRNA G2445 N2-methylase RlmL
VGQQLRVERGAQVLGQGLHPGVPVLAQVPEVLEGLVFLDPRALHASPFRRAEVVAGDHSRWRRAASAVPWAAAPVYGAPMPDPAPHPAIIDQLRLVGVPGTNKVMAGELSRLVQRGCADLRLPQSRKDGLGALAYPFEPRLAALAVRYHRTSTRVLWGLYRSAARRLDPLYRELADAVAGETRPWLQEGARFSIAPFNLEPFAAGARQVVGAAKNALIDGAARRGVELVLDPDRPQLRFDLRLHGEAVVLSLDLAGRPMNQRGYRSETGVAPLRENLAAVLVMLARHDPRRQVLFDPLAGSGTIPIEAACMARGRPLWVDPRRPAAAEIEPVAGHLRQPAKALFPATRPLVLANELDPRMARVARRNLANAGVERYVRFTQGDFRDQTPERVRALAAEAGFDPGRGLILSNPPYGERLSPGRIAEVYRDLGRWCAGFPGWRAAFLVANPEFEAAFGARPRIKKPLNNGPLRGNFYLYDL